MKKAVQILVLLMIIMVPVILTAQPHPYDQLVGGGTGNPTGGAAPIDGGLSVMLILAAAYGSKKLYRAFK